MPNKKPKTATQRIAEQYKSRRGQADNNAFMSAFGAVADKLRLSGGDGKDGLQKIKSKNNLNP